jgi:hypothetical protein
MSEAATVHWDPEVSVRPVKSRSHIMYRGQERPFESLENAVRFVMEDLPETVRHTVRIQTDSASYEGLYQSAD